MRKYDINDLHCILGNFACFFLLLADFFSKSTFSKNYFRNIPSVSNSLDPDQAPCFLGPDLGPSCLQTTLVAQELTSGLQGCVSLKFVVILATN